MHMYLPWEWRLPILPPQSHKCISKIITRRHALLFIVIEVISSCLRSVTQFQWVLNSKLAARWPKTVPAASRTRRAPLRRQVSGTDSGGPYGAPSEEVRETALSFVVYGCLPTCKSSLSFRRLFYGEFNVQTTMMDVESIWMGGTKRTFA
jgi:hypothetical protein